MCVYIYIERERDVCSMNTLYYIVDIVVGPSPSTHRGVACYIIV